ncbi:TIGR03617 family F420-dependent LLM class oxidoreductase [Mycolicibacterium sp. ELW1]|uniref:TIGR03617 family F420-dependent LLM class oxidoreductase n=1 Tax=Mycobacteriaceae TaxID=1762 RepID=UPI0011ED09ED|nr:TIGR03617 family F420-dependent LLM class oxidoreductase [Mycobacterium sp. ELW1]QEN17496.1 TIGR03617 family F420-dependent LLM class oxidoreductase [Mycobacterium sp. ELW1]
MQLVTSAPAAMGPGEIGPWAARAERLGFDVVHISETIHDPFTVAALALQHTERVTVRTSMVLAFPRSPMITAYAAWDLSKFSGGRFQLGIASQVRGNIVGRFSAQWSEPVARLADYIRSLRAIFTSFQTGAKLDYVGPHYRFERLQPYFNPGPLEHPAPQIWTGAVNARMCAMAGELADGFVCHPTNSHPTVLRSRTLPALAEGASRAGRTLADLAVVANPHVMTAATRDAVDTLRDQRRSELAFLYSTPAYRRQLEDFGLADVGAALSAMAQRSEWDSLPSVLTDEVMERLVPQGTYEEIPDVLAQWYSGLCSGINLPVPADEADDDLFAGVLQACRQISG